MGTFLLALTINIDSLYIGINYGLRKIKISFLAMFTIIIMISSSLTFSWFVGHILFSFVSIYCSKIIIFILFFSLGTFLFLEAMLNLYFPIKEEQSIIKKINIKPLKVVIEIAREPSVGDFDHSGVIDYKEAIFVGLALSIDGLTIGLSLPACGISITKFLMITTLLNTSFLLLGQIIGRLLGVIIPINHVKIIAGLTIIFMGIMKLI